ncbi:MAG: hypothetical protein ACI4XB_04165, partial [Ruminococcus sp.]
DSFFEAGRTRPPRLVKPSCQVNPCKRSGGTFANPMTQKIKNTLITLQLVSRETTDKTIE